MRKFSTIFFIFLVIGLSLFSFITRRNGTEKTTELTIYTYDSFVSEWGPGPIVFPAFEKEYGIKVTVISAGDAGQMLQRAILEKDNPKGDILLGIDNNLLYKALSEEILISYRSPGLDKIPEELIFDKTYHITPFDYGYFSIIYDSEKILVPPASLRDLLKPEFNKSLILMDPRTSSPGLGFMLWTRDVFGEGFGEYWKDLMPSVLTITDGWDSAYGLFTQGEAPMVLSYTTSPAYHKEYEDSERYKAAIFPDGHYMQIEGAGIVKGTKHLTEAEQFIDYILETKFQEAIPLTNWMYPVRTDLILPPSFDWAPKPPKSLLISPGKLNSKMESWIDNWIDAVTE